MRKPIVPRFLLLLILYGLIFIALVQVQFAKKTNFTIQAGNLIVQGNYGNNTGNNTGNNNTLNTLQFSNTRSLSGPASVFFGGIEFILGNGLVLSSLDNSENTAAMPKEITIADNEVYFRLDRGPLLIFTTQFTGGAIELAIRVDFSDNNEKYNLLKIPYTPLATSIVQEKNQSFLVNFDGINYSFNRNTGMNTIILDIANPRISYRVLQDKETINPLDYIIPAALNQEEYETALTLWLDQSFLLWNRSVVGGESANGELINAYMSEAIKRGTYRSAVSSVSASAFLNSASDFYEASAYVGRLEAALRSLSAAERDKAARFARLINEKSPDLLKEYRIIEYLAVRGYEDLIDDTAEVLQNFDPAAMTADQAAGFLEGFFDWKRFRPSGYNPFHRFADQALFVITGGLKRNFTNDYSLVFTNAGTGEEADTELNLRLGIVLQQFDDETRIALGRTLILSVFSLTDRTGEVPRKVQGNFTGKNERFDSAEIYRICFTGENYARAQISGPGLWAWTAASHVSGNSLFGRLELVVDFPVGETHYMMIRGIKPFSSLQFNGTNNNSSSQFERIDNSGWIYSSAEQTLLVKIRQRLPAERITVIY